MMKSLMAVTLLAAAPAAAAAAAAADQPLKVSLVDVEGGGATLYVTPEGKSVLIDAGWSAATASPPGPSPQTSTQRIAAVAAKLGVRKIDYLVVTHYHADHVGGVADLMAALPVDTLIDHGANREFPANAAPGAAPPASSAAGMFARYDVVAKGHRRITAKVGEHLQVGSLRLDFVNSAGVAITAPMKGGGKPTAGCPALPDTPPPANENPHSIGIVATFSEARILSLADTTAEVELRLVCPVNQLGKIDLFVVSHHGSALSNTPQLLAATAPRVALLGNGARKGGDRQVLETLAAAPSHPDVWQQHSATRSAELDRPADRIANIEAGPDAGYALDALVWSDGRMRVTNPRTGGHVDYPRR